jgi:hypothetical protein
MGVAAAFAGLLPGIWPVTHGSSTASGGTANGAAPRPDGSGPPGGSLAAGGASSGTGSASHRRGSASPTAGASHGLCYVWQQAVQSGNADRAARAYHNVVIAAGGAYRVDAYCAGIRHHGLPRPTRYPSPRPLISSPAHPSPVPTTESSRLK